MALAAGVLQVGRVDGGGRVGGRQYPVNAVARGAVGDVGVAGLGLETVVGVDEGRQTAGLDAVLLVEHRRLVARRAGHLGDLGPRHRRQRVVRRQDPVLTVAVGAHRRIGLSPIHQLAVDALSKVALDTLVALAAGPRDVEVVDARFCEPGREDLVRRASRGVAVVAARRHVDPAPGRLAVDRSRVDLYRVVDENVVLGGDVEVLVASTAGLGEVGGVDRRAFGGRRQDVVVAVAVGAVWHVLAGAQA